MYNFIANELQLVGLVAADIELAWHRPSTQQHTL
jgi:hypothetical protein